MAKRTEPMYIKIYKDLLKEIQNKTYENALPTEGELCSKYGVSRITVQKALGILVDKDIIRRIPGRGSFLADSDDFPGEKPKLLGVVFCHMTASYGLEIFLEMERYANTKGYSLVFKNSRDDENAEKRAIRELIGLGVEGIIIQPVHEEIFNKKILELSLANFPLVMVDRELKGLNLSYVGTDNAKATRMMMDYLFSKGHKQISMFSSHKSSASTIETRLDAFRTAYLLSGFPYREEYLYTDIRSTGGTAGGEAEDIENICRYLSKNREISCIFCSEYSIAQLTHEAVSRLGMRIPEDISVVTFDAEMGASRASLFTYIRQNQEEMARCCIDIFLSLTKNSDSIQKVRLDAELVDCGSVRSLA